MNVKLFLPLFTFAAIGGHALAGDAVQSTATGSTEVKTGEGKFKVGPVSISVSTSADAHSKLADPQITVTADSVSKSTSGEPSSSPETQRLSAYLGVSSEPVSEVLRAQLGLQPGMGLVVSAVAKGSPAEKAGVRVYDVLTMLNDQMLTSPEHLGTLVKAAGKGANVVLTIIRKAVKIQVQTNLGEGLGEEKTGEKRNIVIGGKSTIQVEGTGGSKIDIQILDLAEQIKKITGALENAAAPSNRSQESQEKALGQGEQKNPGGQLPAEVEVHVREALRKAQEATKKAGGVQVYSFSTPAKESSQKSVAWRNGEIEIQIHEANGKRSAKILEDTREVFSGPLNSEAERAAVPEKHRPALNEAEKGIK